MFKLGGFYLTTKGQLVKIFNSFPFADGYTLNAAIHLIGQGWTAARYAPDGRCNLDGANNQILGATETFDKYLNYLKFVIWFDRAAGLWAGNIQDPRGTVIVSLANLENEDRAIHLLRLGAAEKLLTYMREAGYDEDEIVEAKELVDA